MLGVLGGLAGWAVEVLRVHVDVTVVLGGLGRTGRCPVVLWVRGGPRGVVGAYGGGVLRRVALLGAPMVSWRPADGDGGRVWGAEHVDGFWVLHGMVINETQHVFPGGGVRELLRVYQQEVLAVYHLGCCSADCF